MYRSTIYLLLIAVFMAGCTHAKPVVHETPVQGQAVNDTSSFDVPVKGSVQGSRDRYIISMALKENMGEIRACYENELKKDPNIYGKIIVKFVIVDTGNVKLSEVTKTTMHNAAVEECIAGVVKNTIFPKPKGGGIVVVSYPFVFKPIN